MQKQWIKNKSEIATSFGREAALRIIEAGLEAIDTQRIIESALILENDVLKIKERSFDLKKFKRIKVIGFGKVASSAALVLEKILGDKISEGVVIDVISAQSQRLKTFIGSHPEPSLENVAATRHILDLAKDVSEDDLILVIVSGGGSAMLCWPQEEYFQGQKLYQEFLKSGGTIYELNTIRKHISGLKGGGLAKLFYPATLVGLIFCDISGNACHEVASGPTFKDASTAEDARQILDQYNILGINLNETPKDDMYFKKVSNILLVSNLTALAAMAFQAESLGLKAKIISAEIYDSAEEAIKKIMASSENKTIVLAGGEISIQVKDHVGSGGRNQYLALSALSYIQGNQVFASLASDGWDNSDAAGAIVDTTTRVKSEQLNLNIKEYIKRCDSYNFFKKTGDLIFTGHIKANVADLMLLIN